MRLIDADALNDILEYMINEADIKSWEYVREPVVAHHYEMLKQQIEEILTGISGLPTIESVQPEIIRCKECKHRPIKEDADGADYGFNINAPNGDERCPCLVEDGWYSWMPKDDFYCGYAERRTDE